MRSWEWREIKVYIKLDQSLTGTFFLFSANFSFNPLSVFYLKSRKSVFWLLLLFSMCGIHIPQCKPFVLGPATDRVQFVMAYGRSEWVNYLHANHTLSLKLHFFNWGSYKGIIKCMCSNWISESRSNPASFGMKVQEVFSARTDISHKTRLCLQTMNMTWQHSTEAKRHLAPVVLLLFFICSSADTDAFCAVKLIN